MEEGIRDCSKLRLHTMVQRDDLQHHTTSASIWYASLFKVQFDSRRSQDNLLERRRAFNVRSLKAFPVSYQRFSLFTSYKIGTT